MRDWSPADSLPHMSSCVTAAGMCPASCVTCTVNLDPSSGDTKCLQSIEVQLNAIPGAPDHGFLKEASSCTQEQCLNREAGLGYLGPRAG